MPKVELAINLNKTHLNKTLPFSQVLKTTIYESSHSSISFIVLWVLPLKSLQIQTTSHHLQIGARESNLAPSLIWNLITASIPACPSHFSTKARAVL
jgi:hypothetical protein